MAESPMVGIRIPTDLLSQIDSLRAGEQTRTEVILDLIKRGLGIEPSPDLQAVLKRLDELEGKLLGSNCLTNV